MIYSAACNYGIRAAAHLASRHGGDALIKLRDIAVAEGIPAPFLSQILQRLVAAGLLRSTRGPSGGYALSRAPSSISLHDIKEAVDGVEALEECAVGLGPCSDGRPCPLHYSWKPIRNQIRAYLRETNLEQMAKALAVKGAGLGLP
jgi:Rrf2 family transcriptional regulator, iron-sulfur cluster assembly transcription factor